ncbi:hypothetical protein SDC9_91577 [bioreactor metagenome]|uniref:Uncharacterized protein n=1 Tax=bioreactor metagenome TaxID=1076179 RepID=A0A644ZVE1_9ZZZZ
MHPWLALLRRGERGMYPATVHWRGWLLSDVAAQHLGGWMLCHPRLYKTLAEAACVGAKGRVGGAAVAGAGVDVQQGGHAIPFKVK